MSREASAPLAVPIEALPVRRRLPVRRAVMSFLAAVLLGAVSVGCTESAVSTALTGTARSPVPRPPLASATGTAAGTATDDGESASGTAADEGESVTADGRSHDPLGGRPQLSADGNVVVFGSQAVNLVSGDQNTCNTIFWGALFAAARGSCPDVFVRDRSTAVTSRISLTDDGDEAPAASYGAALSDDGRWVVFESEADLTGEPRRVPCRNVVDPFDGAPRNGESCRYLYRRNLLTARLDVIAVERVEGAPGGNDPYLSVAPDGSWVAFNTDDTALLEPLTDGFNGVLLWEAGELSLLLGSDAPSGYGALNRDGEGFMSDVCIRARTSPDGRWTVHTCRDGLVLVEDAEEQWVVPVANSDGRMSADGTLYVFVGQGAAGASAPCLDYPGAEPRACSRVLLVDFATGEVEVVSPTFDGTDPDGDSIGPIISDDGLVVAFASAASNMVATAKRSPNSPAIDSTAHRPAPDIFVRDRASGTTRLLSAMPNGSRSYSSYAAGVSADGRWVAFVSGAPLVPGDLNDDLDVFVGRASGGDLEAISVAVPDRATP